MRIFDEVLMNLDLPALEELSLGTMAFAKVQAILLNSTSYLFALHHSHSLYSDDDDNQ